MEFPRNKPQQVVASRVAGRSIFEINLRRHQLDLDFNLQWSGPSTMQLCCTLSERVCLEPIHPCITKVRKSHCHVFLGGLDPG